MTLSLNLGRQKQLAKAEGLHVIGGTGSDEIFIRPHTAVSLPSKTVALYIEGLSRFFRLSRDLILAYL